MKPLKKHAKHTLYAKDLKEHYAQILLTQTHTHTTIYSLFANGFSVNHTETC